MPAKWWMTTLLGAIAAIIIPLANNCTFGNDVCQILSSVASAIALLLGATHSGNFKTVSNSAITSEITTITPPVNPNLTTPVDGTPIKK